MTGRTTFPESHAPAWPKGLTSGFGRTAHTWRGRPLLVFSVPVCERSNLGAVRKKHRHNVLSRGGTAPKRRPSFRMRMQRYALSTQPQNFSDTFFQKNEKLREKGGERGADRTGKLIYVKKNEKRRNRREFFSNSSFGS